ncbi:MAG TPA: MFS transporter [Armatimonadetes bacterium]|nr:MFS transporter [Armatimonadota bacterium]
MNTPTSGETGGAADTYNRTRLFAASCIALVTTAMAFSIRADILKEFGMVFNISHEQQGYINLAGIWGFPIAILLVGPLCDVLGMGRLLRFACLGHIIGVVVTILSPAFGLALGYPILLAATLLIGLANGTVEAVINPLCATMYPTEKTHKLNVLHAWWPGGLIIGGLLAYILTAAFGLGWKVKMGTMLIAAVIYGGMILGQKFPPTERAASGVSTAEMFREVLRPGFLLLLFCMCFTAITELGPDQWVGSVLTDTVGIRGILFLVYTAGLMFVLRFFAGPIVHVISPFGLLTCCALLSAVGLFWLSHSFTPALAFAAATVFGVGKTYFWPTMLGVASERFPRSGALGLALVGATGMIAAGIAGPVMGRIYDRYTIENLPPRLAEVVVVDGRYSPEAAARLTDPSDQAALQGALRQGAAMAFRYVAVLPVVLVFIFGVLWFYFVKIKGGYEVVKLGEQQEEGG